MHKKNKNHQLDWWFSELKQRNYKWATACDWDQRLKCINQFFVNLI